MRAHDALRVLCSARGLGELVGVAVQLQELCAPVARWLTVRSRKNVERLVHQRVTKLGMIEIAEDVHTYTFVGQQADDRGAAGETARVIRHEAAAEILLEETKPVRLKVWLHELRRGVEAAGRRNNMRPEQLVEVPLAHEACAIHAAAVEEKSHPLRHVAR